MQNDAGGSAQHSESPRFGSAVMTVTMTVVVTERGRVGGGGGRGGDGGSTNHRASCQVRGLLAICPYPLQGRPLGTGD